MVFVDVDVGVLVHVAVFLKPDNGLKHTPGNFKLLLPPRQSLAEPGLHCSCARRGLCFAVNSAAAAIDRAWTTPPEFDILWE